MHQESIFDRHREGKHTEPTKPDEVSVAVCLYSVNWPYVDLHLRTLIVKQVEACPRDKENTNSNLTNYPKLDLYYCMSFISLKYFSRQLLMRASFPSSMCS